MSSNTRHWRNNIGLLSEMNDLLQGCKTFPDSAPSLENIWNDYFLTFRWHISIFSLG